MHIQVVICMTGLWNIKLTVVKGKPLAKYTCNINGCCWPQMIQDKLHCDRKRMGFYGKIYDIVLVTWQHSLMSMTIRGKQIALVINYGSELDQIPLARLKFRGVASNKNPHCNSALFISVPLHQSSGVLNDWTSHDAPDKCTFVFSNYCKHHNPYTHCTI